MERKEVGCLEGTTQAPTTSSTGPVLTLKPKLVTAESCAGRAWSPPPPCPPPLWSLWVTPQTVPGLSSDPVLLFPHTGNGLGSERTGRRLARLGRFPAMWPEQVGLPSELQFPHLRNEVNNHSTHLLGLL